MHAPSGSGCSRGQPGQAGRETGRMGQRRTRWCLRPPWAPPLWPSPPGWSPGWRPASSRSARWLCLTAGCSPSSTGPWRPLSKACKRRLAGVPAAQLAAPSPAAACWHSCCAQGCLCDQAQRHRGPAAEGPPAGTLQAAREAGCLGPGASHDRGWQPAGLTPETISPRGLSASGGASSAA